MALLIVVGVKVWVFDELDLTAYILVLVVTRIGSKGVHEINLDHLLPFELVDLLLFQAGFTLFLLLLLKRILLLLENLLILKLLLAELFFSYVLCVAIVRSLATLSRLASCKVGRSCILILTHFKYLK